MSSIVALAPSTRIFFPDLYAYSTKQGPSMLRPVPIMVLGMHGVGQEGRCIVLRGLEGSHARTLLM